ncbi:MAG: hypothetical protein COB02_09280 [Candidatus Cloacimonadota bacterium]|nr:MAG: hypothetical protein COB02_09280 [Candidatus Cloacimonadota bacterium]
MNKVYIEEYLGSRNYSLGYSYFKNGSNSNKTRYEAGIIKALCHGSYKYNVEIYFNIDDKITSSYCTCPVLGVCKHIASVLLDYHDSKESFNLITPPKEQIAKLDIKQLRKVLETILDKHPNLNWALDSVIGEDLFDIETYYHQSIDILPRDAYDYHAPRQAAMALDEIISIGCDFLSNDKTFLAMGVFVGILKASIEIYEDYVHEEGDLHAVITQTSECIGECLQKLDKNFQKEREVALDYLFDLVVLDTELGGLSLDEEVANIYRSFTLKNERLFLIKKFEKLLESRNSLDEWKVKEFNNYIFELKFEDLSDEEFIIEGLKRNRKLDVIAKLLKLSRFEEADNYLKDGTINILNASSLYEKYNRVDTFAQIISESCEKSFNYQSLKWLESYYLDKKDLALVFNITKVLFFERPSNDSYDRVLFGFHSAKKKIKLDVVDLQQELLVFIIEKCKGSTKLRLLLHLQEYKKALTFFNNKESNFWENEQINFASKIAEVFPETAIKLYLHWCKKRIDDRGRGNYFSACEYLLKLKNLYEVKNKEDDFLKLILDIKEENNNLPALKSELKKVNL